MGFASLLGINQLDPRLSDESTFYYIINGLRTFSETLLYITMVLFLIDTLSPGQLGIVWGIHFAVLAIVDYPTGVLGDLIGYKTVMLLAYSFKLLATILLLVWQSYTGIILFMILYALGLSQESGAVESWFDNSYKLLEIDTDRSEYTSFIAKLRIFSNIFAGLGFVIGGFITTFISYNFLFFMYLLSVIVILAFILFRMTEVKVIAESTYFSQVQQTLKLFWQNKIIFFYFLGSAVLWACNGAIWHTFLSVRLYRGYSGSVAGAGTIRSIIFVSVIIYSGLVVRFIKKFTATNMWIFISSMVSNSVFFFLILLYYIFFPPTGSFNLLLIIGFLAIYQIPMFLESIESVLRNRLSIDLIPDKYRNSMYSLLPSITQLIGSIGAIITGIVVSDTNLKGAFGWLIVLSFLGSLILGIGLFINHRKTAVVQTTQS